MSGKDALFRRYVCRALGALGHDVEAVEDVAELAGRALAAAPDAIVLDVDPPALAALSAGATARAARPGVRVVVMTDDAGCVERARRAGFPRVLVKPFGLSDLRGALLPL